MNKVHRDSGLDVLSFCLYRYNICHFFSVTVVIIFIFICKKEHVMIHAKDDEVLKTCWNWCQTQVNEGNCHECLLLKRIFIWELKSWEHLHTDHDNDTFPDIGNNNGWFSTLGLSSTDLWRIRRPALCAAARLLKVTFTVSERKAALSPAHS